MYWNSMPHISFCSIPQKIPLIYEHKNIKLHVTPVTNYKYLAVHSQMSQPNYVNARVVLYGCAELIGDTNGSTQINDAELRLREVTTCLTVTAYIPSIHQILQWSIRDRQQFCRGIARHERSNKL
jgi:hypothetical protein